MISFEGVSHAFPGGIQALRDFSLEIPSHSFTVLVGASGSGKTTAMRLVNRLIEPASGRILIDGEDVAGKDPIALRRRIGYVIQGVGLIPHMTVGENAGIVPRLLGWDLERSLAAVRGALETVQLEPDRFLGRYPNQLSGGQRQRVGVARALAADPNIVLMDEPFGALDNVVREEIQEEFLAMFRRLKKTVLFVTHDMLEAVHLGDRIAVMRRGRIVQLGTPAEIVEKPADEFVEKLLGRRRKALEDYIAENPG